MYGFTALLMGIWPGSRPAVGVSDVQEDETFSGGGHTENDCVQHTTLGAGCGPNWRNALGVFIADNSYDTTPSSEICSKSCIFEMGTLMFGKYIGQKVTRGLRYLRFRVCTFIFTNLPLSYGDVFAYPIGLCLCSGFAPPCRCWFTSFVQ